VIFSEKLMWGCHSGVHWSSRLSVRKAIANADGYWRGQALGWTEAIAQPQRDSING
jgi:hypothetical protein